jgi:hypothetical protein
MRKRSILLSVLSTAFRPGRFGLWASAAPGIGRFRNFSFSPILPAERSK